MSQESLQPQNAARMRVLIFLSCLIVVLLGGIWINATFSPQVLPTGAPSTNASPSLLPALSYERNLGTAQDDEFVDCFWVGERKYWFFNSPLGGLLIDAADENKLISYEGKIEKVAMGSNGFALLFAENNAHVLRFVSFDGEPRASLALTEKQVNVQSLFCDGDEVCLGVRYKGDYDYVFAYRKYDESLQPTYERLIYSTYDLSLVKCYALSNQTVFFFNAEYGSLQKASYAVVNHPSLATTYTNFPLSGNVQILDVCPMTDGYLMACKDESGAFCVRVDETFECVRYASFPESVADCSLFGNGSLTYAALRVDGGNHVIRAYTGNGKWDNPLLFSMGATVLDCLFTADSAVFALEKKEKTYLYHASTGIKCVIVDGKTRVLRLQKRTDLRFFTAFDPKNTALTGLGGIDLYEGIVG